MKVVSLILIHSSYAYALELNDYFLSSFFLGEVLAYFN